MQFLQKLRPAEILLIREPVSMNLNEAIKLTVVDLILRGVFELKSIEKKTNYPGKKSFAWKLADGPEFCNYEAEAYEKIFINLFNETIPHPVSLYGFLSEIYWNRIDEKKFIKTVRKSKRLKGYLERKLYHVFFGGLMLSNEGMVVLRELSNETNSLTENISVWKKEDKNQIHKLISEIKGNAFLFSDLQIPLLQWMDKRLNDFQIDAVRTNLHASQENWSDDFPDISFDF